MFSFFNFPIFSFIFIYPFVSPPQALVVLSIRTRPPRGRPRGAWLGTPHRRLRALGPAQRPLDPVWNEGM
jgi:hypothetical protein